MASAQGYQVYFKYQDTQGLPNTPGGRLSIRARGTGTFFRSSWSYRSRVKGTRENLSLNFLWYILSKSGRDYRVAHSGTQISSLSKEYMSPTLITRKSFSRKAALCPQLNTIKCRDNLRVRFQLGTKRAKSHKIK